MGRNPFKQNSGERRKKPGNTCPVLQNGPYASGSKYSIPGSIDCRKPHPSDPFPLICQCELSLFLSLRGAKRRGNLYLITNINRGGSFFLSSRTHFRECKLPWESTPLSLRTLGLSGCGNLYLTTVNREPITFSFKKKDFSNPLSN